MSSHEQNLLIWDSKHWSFKREFRSWLKHHESEFVGFSHHFEDPEMGSPIARYLSEVSRSHVVISSFGVYFINQYVATVIGHTLPRWADLFLGILSSRYYYDEQGRPEKKAITGHEVLEVLDEVEKELQKYGRDPNSGPPRRANLRKPYKFLTFKTVNDSIDPSRFIEE